MLEAKRLPCVASVHRVCVASLQFCWAIIQYHQCAYVPMTMTWVTNFGWCILKLYNSHCAMCTTNKSRHPYMELNLSAICTTCDSVVQVIPPSTSSMRTPESSRCCSRKRSKVFPWVVLQKNCVHNTWKFGYRILQLQERQQMLQVG